MKTHEREDPSPYTEAIRDSGGGIIDVWTSDEPIHVAHARWKRKNRFKRLKHTISKLAYENAVFKQTFIQKRAFLKRLKAICREPNRSPLHRLADIDRELQIELMATKDYDRKEQQ